MRLKLSLLFVSMLLLFQGSVLQAQIGAWNPNLIEDANEALEVMIEQNPKLEDYKNEAFGYAVFPKITKAGMGIGGAAGNGIVYKDGEVVGSSKLKQASFGFQFGGQQYREVIFFEHEDAFEQFINDKVKFDAQASAVAITEGASIDAVYADGIAIFTSTKGGLMYEASVGGQHFKYKEMPEEKQKKHSSQ